VIGLRDSEGVLRRGQRGAEGLAHPSGEEEGPEAAALGGRGGGDVVDRGGLSGPFELDLASSVGIETSS
jgi:hypothetical protein